MKLTLDLRRLHLSPRTSSYETLVEKILDNLRLGWDTKFIVTKFEIGDKKTRNKIELIHSVSRIVALITVRANIGVHANTGERIFT